MANEQEKGTLEGSTTTDRPVVLRLATTLPDNSTIELKGRIYNRAAHDSQTHPDWARDPQLRKVTFRSIEEPNLSAWLVEAQKRKDKGIDNILITDRVSERTYGQRPLWLAILAANDIRHSRIEGADSGKEKDHNNPHDKRLREKFMSLSPEICPVFVQLLAAMPERFPQISDVKYDNHLIHIVYKANKLSITIYENDDVTPALTFIDLNVATMKLTN